MSFAEITAEIAAYRAAINARDYETALDQAMILAATLAGTPDVERRGSGSSQQAEWASAELIVKTMPTLERKARAAGAGGGIQVQTITPTRAGL